jgi:hypothetical protein
LGNSSLFLAPAGFSVGLDFLMNIPISLGTAIWKAERNDVKRQCSRRKVIDRLSQSQQGFGTTYRS